jgi:hypothetical protein
MQPMEAKGMKSAFFSFDMKEGVSGQNKGKTCKYSGPRGKEDDKTLTGYLLVFSQILNFDFCWLQ